MERVQSDGVYQAEQTLKIMQRHLLKRNLNCIMSFFDLWGTKNWYEGIEETTWWDRIYKKRVSPYMAFRLARYIWLDKKL